MWSSLASLDRASSKHHCRASALVLSDDVTWVCLPCVAIIGLLYTEKLVDVDLTKGCGVTA
jgi:hypothetical protein